MLGNGQEGVKRQDVVEKRKEMEPSSAVQQVGLESTRKCDTVPRWPHQNGKTARLAAFCPCNPVAPYRLARGGALTGGCLTGRRPIFMHTCTERVGLPLKNLIKILMRVHKYI